MDALPYIELCLYIHIDKAQMVGKRLLMLLVAVLRLSFQPELTQKADPWTKNMAHMSTVFLTIVSIFVSLDINSVTIYEFFLHIH